MEFLEKYKELEELLREENATVLIYEEALESADDKDKLRISRQMRNYIQHHSDNFLSPTKEMVAFISSLVEKEKAKKEKVKDRLKRLKAVKDTDKLEDVCKWMSKNKKTYAPIVDKNGAFLGVLTTPTLITALTKLSLKKKVAEVGKLSKECTVASSGDELNKYTLGEEVIVVDKSIYKGLIDWRLK